MTLTISVAEVVEKSANPLLAKKPSWGRVRCGDVAEIQNGFAFKTQFFSNDAGMPLIRIRDIGSEQTETKYTGEYDAAYIVELGDLLVGMDGDFNCARWRGPRGLLNQRVCRIRLTSDAYHPRLLDFVLPGYLKAINDATSSVTVKHLSSRSVADIPLPLPPWKEQLIIVAEIERQFSRLDEAVANLKRVKANIRRYRVSLLKAACAGHLGECGESWVASHNPTFQSKASGDVPPGWSLQRIDDLLSDDRDGLRTGPFGTLLSKSDHRPSGVPVLGIENIVAMRFRSGSKIHIDRRKAEQLKSYSVLPSDVLISRSGTVGEVCVVPEGLGEARISTNILRVRLNRSAVEPKFFCILFNGSPFILDQVRELCRGSTRDFLNQGILRSIVFPLPPITEQFRIVAEVERRLSMADESEAQVDANLLRAERLRQAILKRAFEARLG